MKRSTIAIALVITFFSVIGVQAQANWILADGSVHFMTNQTANAVVTFARNSKTGALTLIDTEPTQGAGNPIPIEPDPSVDPLASQGSLIVDEKNGYVYAVNAGSNDISVLAIEARGLRFVQKISSGGTRPISLAIHRKWLYVLNEGGVTPTISGYTIRFGGSLVGIEGSTRPLVGGSAADPAQIGFNNDGTMLVVSEKSGNRFDLYNVDANGVAGPPTAAPSYGMKPFGFAFGPRGHLFAAEPFNPLGVSAISSYATSSPLSLDPVSGSVTNGQEDTCWVEVTNDGSRVITSNPGSGTLSTYAATRDGRLTLLRAVAGFPGTDSAPVDIALDPNDKFLYVLENGSHKISAWRLLRDGSLSLVGKYGDVPAGAQGIAVR